MENFVFEKTFGAKRFQVLQNDLLSEPVDCIVNAANSGLSHGGGIAAAISEAAGASLDEACERVIAKVGRIPAGYAAITTAGNLSFKAVIHAVGPRQGDGDEESTIVRTLSFAFRLAEKRGFSSLAFPAISSGIFGVPPEICARAYRRAVEEHFSTQTGGSLQQIRLCLYSGPVWDEVVRTYR